MANKKITTLYIDDTSIRLLVTSGQQVKKWADSPLETGLVKNGVVLKEEEVAAKVKQLFKILKVRTKKIILGISGLHCLSRPITLPQLPDEMLDEAVRREAKRVLPVPLEQLYLSWQTIPAPPGKTQVFLVAIPCNTADAMHRTMLQAGLKPYLMDLKPLSLARAVRETTAIIIDVQPSEYDIVIMVDGICQPVRTVPLPRETTNWTKKLPLIRNDLSRTIEFYNSNNPERTLSPAVPVFVSGELANESKLCQSLSDEIGHHVLPITPPLLCPGAGLEPHKYMVNMGLTLKEIPLVEASGLTATNLNTMPAPYRPKPISITNIIAVTGITVAVGLLIFLVMLIQSASADVTSIRGQLYTTDQLLQRKLAQRQELTAQIAELEQNITEAEASGNTYIAAAGSIEGGNDRLNGLEVAVKYLPNTVNLTGISYIDGTLTLTGTVPDEEEALSYLETLEASGKFAEITITSMRMIEGEGIDFTLVLRVGE